MPVNRVITRTDETAEVPGRSTGFNLGASYAVTYGYEAGTGRFRSINWSAGAQTENAVYGYLNNSDLIEQLTINNSLLTTYTYEADRNLKTQVKNEFNTQLVSQYDYNYNSLGLRDHMDTSGSAFTGIPIEPTPETSTYNTNSLNQYTQITKDNGQQTTDTLTYDDDGNLTSISSVGSTKTYKYNAENRLISVEPSTPVDGDKKSEFIYDYMGRRVQKKVYAYSSSAYSLQSIHLFFYDGWNMIQEMGAAGVVQKSYVWGLDLSQSQEGAGGVGGLISVVDSGEIYHFLYDYNGNVGQVVKASDGSIVAHYEYDPFGILLKSYGVMKDANPIRFSTKYYDIETDLYYYGYRFYSTSLGRWVNRDPIEEQGAVGNLYLFIYNDAINDVDVLGLKSLDEIEQQYRDIISRGRIRGWNVAADNLQHFLDGGGNKRSLRWSWLRGYDSVLRAEKKNRERFINQTLKDKIRKYKSGVVEVLDWWDAQEKESVSTQLYFVSGSFTLTSYGKFELSCVKDGKVRVKGSIDHYWWDIYDWHAGLFADVPTFGKISDADALALKNAGRADEYLMDSIWYDTIDVQLEKNRFSISDYIWRGPSGGTSGAKAAVILYAPNSIPSTLRLWLQ